MSYARAHLVVVLQGLLAIFADISGLHAIPNQDEQVNTSRWNAVQISCSDINKREFDSLDDSYFTGRCMRRYEACDRIIQLRAGVRAGKSQPDAFSLVVSIQLSTDQHTQMIRTAHVPQ
jgi:nitrous oxide reductase